METNTQKETETWRRLGLLEEQITDAKHLEHTQDVKAKKKNQIHINDPDLPQSLISFSMAHATSHQPVRSKSVKYIFSILQTDMGESITSLAEVMRHQQTGEGERSQDDQWFSTENLSEKRGQGGENSGIEREKEGESEKGTQTGHSGFRDKRTEG